MYSLMMILSVVLDRIEVSEIGLKSAGVSGFFIFGIGTIRACFHCLGTVDCLILRFISLASG